MILWVKFRKSCGVLNQMLRNKELSVWETRRNAGQKGVDWHFTANDARTKKCLYPIIV
jgi:hypothetical protein